LTARGSPWIEVEDDVRKNPSIWGLVAVALVSGCPAPATG
jgi:hypothetical protein